MRKIGYIAALMLSGFYLAQPGQADPLPRARILAIEAIDDGSGTTATTSIDVIQDTCGSGSDATAEPFFDTILRIKVFNQSNAEILFNKFTYSVNNFDGSGSQLNSAPLALVGSGRVPKGKDGTELVALFIKTNAGRKYFTRTTTPIPSDLGFKNITVKLEGRTARKQKVRVSARTTLSFANFDRCGS